MENSGRSRRDGWIAAGRESIFPLREVWRSSGRSNRREKDDERALAHECLLDRHESASALALNFRSWRMVARNCNCIQDT